MSFMIRCSIAVGLALLAGVQPSAAQNFRTAVGYGGGAVLITPLNQGSTGSARELRLEAGWILSGGIDHWFGSGRLGIRAHGAYTQRPFGLADRTLDINTWFADAGVVLRPFAPGGARGVAPFLSVGAGLVRYAFGRGAAVNIQEANARYDGDSERQWAGVFGLGVDIGPAFEIQETALGLRIELADHVALESPFDPLTGDRFGPVHNIRITVSLVSMLGELPALP